jgi:hypothetical protein
MIVDTTTSAPPLEDPPEPDSLVLELASSEPGDIVPDVQPRTRQSHNPDRVRFFMKLFGVRAFAVVHPFEGESVPVEIDATTWVKKMRRWRSPRFYCRWADVFVRKSFAGRADDQVRIAAASLLSPLLAAAGMAFGQSLSAKASRVATTRSPPAREIADQ